MTTLNFIDIASWQAGIRPKNIVDADGIIVKATGGTSYLNPYFRQWADETLEAGKLLGIYHYANDIKWGSAVDEARWFLENVKPYIGRFVPILDWESEALGNPVSWCDEWLSIVERETGSTPMFYGYASNVNSSDYSAITRYPLWMASYLNKYIGTDFVDDPDNIWGTGDWERMTMYQYTSQGHVRGYSGNLDLSAFHGTREDWERLQGGRHMVQLGNVAAAWHGRMCDDPRFGYTQGTGRWGATPVETWETEGLLGKFAVGDRDCSSSVIDVWREVFENTPYAGCLDAASYTGNMKSVFTGSGFFEWKPMSFIAQPGDLYLYHNPDGSGHTAMCQSAVPDMLSEFLINEKGQIIGGQVGDQTGRESIVRGYYDPGWHGILHYNGKADIEAEPNEWPVVMWESNGGQNQRFEKVDVSGAYFQLVCKLDGRALDVKGGTAEKGTEVILWPVKGDDVPFEEKKNQLWAIQQKDNGTFELVSALDINLCLDVVNGNPKHGAKLCIWERHLGTNQEWIFLDNHDGSVSVLNNGETKMVIDRAMGAIS